jgi:diguanylate cyclase (GGDEF)-like protein
MATELHGLSSCPSAENQRGRSAHELAQAHLALARSLQTTLSCQKILQLFFRHLPYFVPVSGLEYLPAEGGNIERLGTADRHQCDYRLTCEETPLGQLIFRRDRRFSEAERQLLEELLGTLVFPLRNALRYHNAVRLALVDALTGLGNRAALDSTLHRELQLAERHQRALSLLAIDLDHFKRINDSLGHSYGDQILRQVADTIQSACRATDMCFRYGGEEFVVLLSNTHQEGAKIIAERIRAEVNALPVEAQQNISVSIGISTRHAVEQEHVNALFERADLALYKAKAQGRNCIVAEDSISPCRANQTC